MIEQPERLSDREVENLRLALGLNLIRDPIMVSLLAEVQENRALNAKRKCETCVHGEPTGNGFFVRCGHKEASHPDWFCADWEAKP